MEPAASLVEEVVRVDALQQIRVGQRDSDFVVDHEICKQVPVDEDDLLADAGDVLARLGGKH